MRMHVWAPPLMPLVPPEKSQPSAWPAGLPQAEVDSPAEPSLSEPTLSHLQGVSQPGEAGGAPLATCMFMRRNSCPEPLEAGVGWSSSPGVAAADRCAQRGGDLPEATPPARVPETRPYFTVGRLHH